MAGEVKLILTKILADWQFARDTFKLPQSYSNNQEVCHRCVATKTAGPYDMCNFGQYFPLRSNEQYLQDVGHSIPLAVSCPGFSICVTMPEAMHAGPLGVFTYANASAI